MLSFSNRFSDEEEEDEDDDGKGAEGDAPKPKENTLRRNFQVRYRTDIDVCNPMWFFVS